MAWARISRRRPTRAISRSIVLGVAIMSIVVTLFNRLFWRPTLRLRRKASAALIGFAEETCHARPDRPRPLLDVSPRQPNLRQGFGRGRDRRCCKDVSLTLALGRDRRDCSAAPDAANPALLRLIVAGLSRPTEGTVMLAGKPVDGPAEGVAMVFQSFALFPVADGARQCRDWGRARSGFP